MNHLVEAERQEKKLREQRAEGEKRVQMQVDEIKTLTKDVIRSMETKHEGISQYLSLPSRLFSSCPVQLTHLAPFRGYRVPDPDMVSPAAVCRDV